MNLAKLTHKKGIFSLFSGYRASLVHICSMCVCMKACCLTDVGQRLLQFLLVLQFELWQFDLHGALTRQTGVEVRDVELRCHCGHIFLPCANGHHHQETGIVLEFESSHLIGRNGRGQRVKQLDILQRPKLKRFSWFKQCQIEMLARFVVVLYFYSIHVLYCGNSSL